MAHTTVTDGVDDVLAAHHNELAAALDVLEATPRCVLYGGMNNSSPAASATYYFGQPLVATITAAGLTSPTEARIIIPYAGTISRIDMRILVATTLASAEASTLYLRYNNTTDTLISNAIYLNSKATAYSANVTIAVAAGDYVEFKWATPAWGTLPTAVYISGQLFM